MGVTTTPVLSTTLFQYISLWPPSHNRSFPLFPPETDCWMLTSEFRPMLSKSVGQQVKFSHTAASFWRFCGDGSSRVVSGGQHRFNWFSFSLRLLLGPQRLSMGTANWPSPVATWRSRQTRPSRHFCRSIGTTADKKFMLTSGSVYLLL